MMQNNSKIVDSFRCAKRWRATEKYIPYFVLFLLFLLMIYRCHFSFSQNDESLYPALAHRLWLGDRLFIDETNLTQIYSPLLLPVYYLFRALNISSMGSLLFFRLAYALLSFFVGLFFLKVCRIYTNTWIALAGASMCMIYARANIFGMSYYSMSFLMLISAICCIPIVMKNEYRMAVRRFASIMLGIFYSCSVLCCPYYAAFVPMIAVLFFKKDRRPLALWIFFTVIFCACAYVVFFLPIGELSLFLESLKMRATTVMPGGTTTPLSMLRIALENFFMSAKKEGVVAVAFCIAVIVIWKIKNCVSERVWLIHHAVSLLFLIPRLPDTVSSVCHVLFVPFDVLMFPVALYVFISKKDRFPLIFYGAGVIAAFLFGMASNTRIDAMTSGFCIAFIGMLLMIPLIHPSFDNRGASRVMQATVALLILVVMVPSICQRFIGVYRDAPIQELNTMITKGPAKGLRTTEEHAEQYGIIFDTIERVYEKEPDASVMHSRNLPWAYLCNDWEIGTYTVWASLLASEKMDEYFKMNPDKIPDYVFLYSSFVGSFEKSPFNDHGSSKKYNDQELSGEFYERLVHESDVIERNEFVTVYRLKES